MHTKRFALSMLPLLALSFAPAFAVTLSSTGVMSDIYSFVVVDVLQGPIGFMAGILAIACSVYCVVCCSDFKMGVPCFLGGFMLLTLPSLTTSFGAMLI